MSRQWRILEQDVALAFQHVPNIDVPRRTARHDTRFHSLPQPGQELSTERAACLGDSSKNVKSFDVFTRENVKIPDVWPVCEFIPEVYHREVREDFQEGLVWKLKDYSPC